MEASTVFHNPTKGRLQIADMLSEISRFVKEAPDNSYRLVIGTDSQLRRVNGKSECDFVTAIVVHRQGNDAC